MPFTSSNLSQAGKTSSLSVRGCTISLPTLLIVYIVSKAHNLPPRVERLHTSLACRLLGLPVRRAEVAASAIACLEAFRTRPQAGVADDIGRIDIKMSVEPSVTEKRCALVTSPTFPVRVLDATKMAKSTNRMLLGLHQVVDCCS